MIIEKLITGPLGVNTYIVHSQECGECAVIDPGNSHKVERLLTEKGLRCTHILLTHAHFDHTLGVAELKAKYGAKVYIHEAGVNAMEGGKESLSAVGGVFVKPCKVDRALHDGDSFTAAGIGFKTLHTPGHTKDGVCYIAEAERVIFSGDTLFRLSVGRTDFAGGSADEIYDSITRRLFALEGDYRVLPGHLDETTLDFERKHNPYVRNFGADYK